MCGPEMCTPPLINSYEPHILSFGEDEGGMLKIISQCIVSILPNLYISSLKKNEEKKSLKNEIKIFKICSSCTALNNNIACITCRK